MALNRAEFVGTGDVLVQRAHEDMHVRTVWGTTACLSRPYLFGRRLSCTTIGTSLFLGFGLNCFTLSAVCCSDQFAVQHMVEGLSALRHHGDRRPSSRRSDPEPDLTAVQSLQPHP